MAAPNVKKPKANSPSRKRGLKLRSGLEAVVEGHLANSALPYRYEHTTLTYLQPSITRRYLPDFEVTTPKGGVFLEVKGILTSMDRKKLRFIKEQYPKLILVMVFGNAKNRLNKKSSTTYSQWCDRYDILWIDVKDFIRKDIKECLLDLMKKQANGKSTISPKKKSNRSSK